jgi:hypothetical protein
MVGPSPTEKAPQKIAAPRRDVEEARLNRSGKVKAWVENISYWYQERVHIPDAGRRRCAYDDEVWVFEE